MKEYEMLIKEYEVKGFLSPEKMARLEELAGSQIKSASIKAEREKRFIRKKGGIFCLR
jgi:hypothetical protein